jgi:hypothetical protein
VIGLNLKPIGPSQFNFVTPHFVVVGKWLTEKHDLPFFTTWHEKDRWEIGE